MPAAHARIATEEASRLIKRLCTHWSHKFAVEFDETHGRVPFDASTAATLNARDGQLDVRVEAEDAERLARMQDVVAEHLQRMARAEQPLQIDWQPGEPDVA